MFNDIVCNCVVSLSKLNTANRAQHTVWPSYTIASLDTTMRGKHGSRAMLFIAMLSVAHGAMQSWYVQLSKTRSKMCSNRCVQQALLSIAIARRVLGCLVTAGRYH